MPGKGRTLKREKAEPFSSEKLSSPQGSTGAHEACRSMKEKPVVHEKLTVGTVVHWYMFNNQQSGRIKTLDL